MGGVLLNEARRVLVPAATHDEQTHCMSARAVAQGRRWAHLMSARSIHIDKHWPDYPAKSARGVDERARGGREELSEIEGAHHGHGSQIRADRSLTFEDTGRGVMHPRPGSRSPSGSTLVELLLVGLLIAIVAAASIPQVMVSLDRSRALGASRYIASRMLLARAQAVSRTATVAVRFEDTAAGTSVAVFIDGNRNGVRMQDIQSGADVPIDPPILLAALFPGVTLDLPPTMSRLFSFTPSGTATSGTVYLIGRDGSRFAVRVLGVTARARVLRYVPARDVWIETS